MKHKFLIFTALLFMSIMITSSVSAIETNLTYSTSSIAQITSLKYEPYPVNPGEYFDIWISVKFLRDPKTDVEFELLSEYPFSSDLNESAVKTYSAGAVSSSVLVKYKVRVDDNAVEGTNKLTLIYKFEGTYYMREFDIEVSNAQTNFDAVIQDATSSEVSIAIANIGKNTANSVIVKIPEQENFEATGTDGQMVGNLESGDYSIVSFEISKKMTQQIPSEDESDTKMNFFGMQSSSQPSNLTFDIYYTDNIGVRRVVSMQLPVSMENTNSSMMGRGEFGRGQSSVSWWVYFIILAVLLIIFFVIYKKFPDQTKKFLKKINPKKLFRKKENQITAGIPDWVKKTKEKEKIK